MTKTKLGLMRLVALASGCALMLAPAYLAAVFASGVGEPPRSSELWFYAGIVIVPGLPFGLGLFLVGLPGLVAGRRSPAARAFAGALLTISALAIAALGFDGTVNRVVSPVVLLIELAAFSLFVWPATPFNNTEGRT